jgi:hypothetical protein
LPFLRGGGRGGAKFVNAVQKSVSVFEGGVGAGGRVCVCKSYSMDSLLLSKSEKSNSWEQQNTLL